LPREGYMGGQKNRRNWATPEAHVVVGMDRAFASHGEVGLKKVSKRMYHAHQMNLAITEFQQLTTAEV